jgi:hypothetical protein
MSCRFVRVGSETRDNGSVVKVASASARIWKNNSPGNLGWVEQATGRKLERGLSVLVKMSQDFSRGARIQPDHPLY